ncbi:alpha/beta fold hydrolase [Halodesulfovibrio aestuarii]|uniref:Pimeloyl-ACP methyl ester carboxylesterase n=1 Tax=Halodesulfovibrio aestuarii TaxID=126333 RepID=A0A8G2C8H7_9BACT|nr:alpha/beta fold hydrolase [Halodesulfovibrio aestuarii]SHI81642.1 Pimeloyl-ACP methyl ester carboxylesterase [Halodesulfovibrio aestuarii]
MQRRFSLFLCMLALFVICGCAAHQNHQGRQDKHNIRVQTASVNGVHLGYRVTGSGPPLLLIMGYAGTMDVWDPSMVAELAKERTVILFDNRGMGYSSINNAPLSIELMASDAVALLNALGIKRADIMGWSMGSVIAQEIALNHPDKVDKLVLYATAVDLAPVKAALDRMGALSQKQFMAQLFPDTWKNLHPDIFSKLPVPAIAPSPEVIQRQYKAVTNWRGTRDQLASLNTDTLVIVGQADRITPPDQALAAVNLIKGAWLVRFKGAGHWLMYQAGEDMALTIERFLDAQENLLSNF